MGGAITAGSREVGGGWGQVGVALVGQGEESEVTPVEIVQEGVKHVRAVAFLAGFEGGGARDVRVGVAV